MSMLDDYRCEVCENVHEGWRDEKQVCCGLEMTRLMGGHHFEWGGPRQIRTMREEPFSSKGDMKAWCKERGLEEAGDKVGGARNEDHRDLGTLYSYPGAPTRSRMDVRRNQT